jgi:carbohydrate-selective porin OprB
MPITDWLTLQPDLQYIIDTGALGELKNALVLGLRFEIGRAF